MVVHLDHIRLKFEYQGHRVKVKVTLVKLIILTVGPQILLPDYKYDDQGHGHLKVKVILRSFGNQTVSV